MPTFLSRYRGLSLQVGTCGHTCPHHTTPACVVKLVDWLTDPLAPNQNAGFVIGVATVLGGIGGLFLGASVADLCVSRFAFLCW